MIKDAKREALCLIELGYIQNPQKRGPPMKPLTSKIIEALV